MTKRILVCCLALLGISIPSLDAQSQLITELTNAVTELTGSFMDNPYHHSNTIKIYELTQDFKKTTDELITEAIYSDHPQAQKDLPYLNNIKRILKCLDFLTASITGYIRGGIERDDVESFLHPIFDNFGWTWSIIHSTSDIVLYEYKKDQYRMVLAKNVRPKKEGGDYNAVSFTCYTWEPIYKKEIANGGRIVFGGNYTFVTFGDDEKSYRMISKITSTRETK